jgi:hypothetical protein
MQGCCFVKYNSLIAAQSAINALHNQRSLPPLRNPLQVRFADSGVNSADRGQTNAENKLFVGGVPPGCGDKELRALFNTYGEVLDVYILASKASQEGQRGCAFVRYAAQQSCAMAIEALHGKYAMKAGELPLVVRYADPPKSQRNNGAYGHGGRMPPGWPHNNMWPGGPPPMGWPGMGWGMPGGQGMGMPGGFPPWAMPPMANQPGVPPYAYYGGQFGGQAGAPQGAAGQAQAHYGQMPPPPPPQQVYGGKGGGQPPLPPPAPNTTSQPAGQPWTEHVTPDGLRYYYNTSTGTSSWERPAELAGAQISQPVPPLPPLPAGGAATTAVPPGSSSPGGGGNGAGLEQAMEALSMGAAPPVSSGQMGYASNGLGLGGLSGLGSMPANSAAAVDPLGGEHASVVVTDWPGGTAELRQAFSRFGTITFCEADGATGGTRVTFDGARSAKHAVDMMNGLAVGDKKLHVALGF